MADYNRWWLLQICADSFSLHFLFHSVCFTLLGWWEVICSLDCLQSELIRILKGVISYHSSELDVIIQEREKLYWTLEAFDSTWGSSSGTLFWGAKIGVLNQRNGGENLDTCIDWRFISFHAKDLLLSWVDFRLWYTCFKSTVLGPSDLPVEWKDFPKYHVCRCGAWEYLISATNSICLSIILHTLNSHLTLCRSVNHLFGSKLLKDSCILLAFWMWMWNHHVLWQKNSRLWNGLIKKSWVDW